MSQITASTFERAVAQYFGPIAGEHGWPVTRQRPGVYEILSDYFAMRIRFEVGAHRKSINATLIPTNQMPGDIENCGQGELGIAVVAGYNGMSIEYIPWDQTEEGLFEEARHMANMVKQFGLPYLLGQKSDWGNVRKFIDNKSQESAEEVKKYRFPASVQKRWHLPPPPTEAPDKK